mmetsp:Transcript_21127/g.50736  ORF Transcript_21127/g.50736 Transcript_21127/m.50736 type:complete len:104 (-) Transcript_21127:451-762(-)
MAWLPRVVAVSLHLRLACYCDIKEYRLPSLQTAFIDGILRTLLAFQSIKRSEIRPLHAWRQSNAAPPPPLAAGPVRPGSRRLLRPADKWRRRLRLPSPHASHQ